MIRDESKLALIFFTINLWIPHQGWNDNTIKLTNDVLFILTAKSWISIIFFLIPANTLYIKNIYVNKSHIQTEHKFR